MGMTALLTNSDHTQNEFIATGTITLSGTYGTSGGALPHGDTLDLSQLGIPSDTIPYLVNIWSTVPQGSAPIQDRYDYLPGTTQANGVVQCSLAGTEITPGATYASTSPFNTTGFVLNFQAFYKALV